MKNLLYGFIAILVFAALGCGPPPPPPEPTPDVQAKMQAETQMKEWFADVRYAEELTEKAGEKLLQRMHDAEANDKDYSDAAKLIAYFEEPGGLKERLHGKLKALNERKTKLEGNKEKDTAHFKNLGDLTTILGKMINTVTTLPASAAAFKEAFSKPKRQFHTIETLLKKSYPESDGDLAQRKSAENPEFKRDSRIFDAIPTPGPAVPEVEPTATVPVDTPTPTPGPMKVWTDANGITHMGQEPPENAKPKDLGGKISKGIAIEPKTTPEGTPPASGSSLIWTDANGVVHMGQEAPEGATTKEAKDIDLMIQDK